MCVGGGGGGVGCPAGADPLRFLSAVCCRLRPGEGLHHARLHAEAREPLPDSVAAPLLLPLPQPCGVEGGGRVTGESTSWRVHTHTHTRHFLHVVCP